MCHAGNLSSHVPNAMLIRRFLGAMMLAKLQSARRTRVVERRSIRVLSVRCVAARYAAQPQQWNRRLPVTKLAVVRSGKR